MFNEYRLKLVRPEAHPDRPEVNAIVEVDADLTEVLPFLNADLGSCAYNPEGPYLRFTQSGKAFTVHPRHLTIIGLTGPEEAHRLIKYLRAVLEDIWARKDEITPSYRRGNELKVLDVYRLLPRTNCGGCGEQTCLAFACRLLSQEFSLQDCPSLAEKEHEDKLFSLTGLMRETGYPV